MRTNITREKILELLFQFPLRKFHVREISRIVKISAPAVSIALKQFEKEEIISPIIKDRITYEVQSNFSDQNFRNLKRVYNLQSIYSSGIYSYLFENFPMSAIILFGSYSRGDDTEKSDIDIFIDSKEKKLEFEGYEKKLNRKINIEFANLKKTTEELRNNIINGIVLSGYIHLK